MSEYPKRLVPVRCSTVQGEPDGIHLSVLEWEPKFQEWVTGPAICGQSADQGALRGDTPITCAGFKGSCEDYRGAYERALAGRPTAEQEELQQLRRKLRRIEEMAAAWEQRLPDTIRTAAVVDAIRTTIHP